MHKISMLVEYDDDYLNTLPDEYEIAKYLEDIIEATLYDNADIDVVKIIAGPTGKRN